MNGIETDNSNKQQQQQKILHNFMMVLCFLMPKLSHYRIEHLNRILRFFHTGQTYCVAQPKCTPTKPFFIQCSLVHPHRNIWPTAIQRKCKRNICESGNCILMNGLITRLSCLSGDIFVCSADVEAVVAISSRYLSDTDTSRSFGNLEYFQLMNVDRLAKGADAGNVSKAHRIHDLIQILLTATHNLVFTPNHFEREFCFPLSHQHHFIISNAKLNQRHGTSIHVNWLRIYCVGKNSNCEFGQLTLLWACCWSNK